MGWSEDIRIRFPDWGMAAARERWPAAKARLSIGQVVRGQVIARAPFGVWLDIGTQHPALLLVPEMKDVWERRIDIQDYPPVGAILEARIAGLGDNAEIALTQRLLPDTGCPSTLTPYGPHGSDPESRPSNG